MARIDSGTSGLAARAPMVAYSRSLIDGVMAAPTRPRPRPDGGVQVEGGPALAVDGGAGVGQHGGDGLHGGHGVGRDRAVGVVGPHRHAVGVDAIVAGRRQLHPPRAGPLGPGPGEHAEEEVEVVDRAGQRAVHVHVGLGQARR